MIPEIAATPMPPRIAALPRDARGYPVPRFVQWKDGVPLFPVMDGEHVRRCIKRRVCWICGDVLGREMTFVVGPMCCVNRASSEPPSHRSCAVYAATVCPFLARPHMKRTPERDDTIPAPGIMVDENPGASALWTTRAYETIRAPRGNAGILFLIGDPTDVTWFASGQRAEPAEILEAFETSVVRLRTIAERLDNAEGMRELEVRIAATRKLVIAA